MILLINKNMKYNYSTKKSQWTSRKSFLTIISLFAVLFTLPTFYACGDDEDNKDGGSGGQSDKEQAYIKSKDADKTIDVAAKGWPGWTSLIESNIALKDLKTSSSATWCSAELKESGTNKYELTMYAEDNNTTEEREAIITVSDNNKNSVSFNLKQAAGTSEDATTVVNNVVQLDLRTLFVHTNVSARVEGVNFNFSMTGTDVEIANAPATGSIKISAAGRRTKTINFDFKDGAVLYYDVELVSGGLVYSQADVEYNGATVTNGDGNKDDNDGVEASFSLNGETNNGATGDYSITVFTPSDDTNGEDVTFGQNLAVPLLAIDCKPDGAAFSNPIDVYLNIPGCAGYDIAVKNGNEMATTIQDGDRIIAKVPHFSIWDIILNLACSEVVSSTYTYDDVKVNAKNGSASISVVYGYETDASTAKSVIAKKLLKKMFGTPKRALTKSVKWNAVEGEATIKATQNVKTYTFISAQKTIRVTVYGKITTSISIETTTPEDVINEGGGSN